MLLLRGSGGKRLGGRLLGGVGWPFFFVFLSFSLVFLWFFGLVLGDMFYVFHVFYVRGSILLGCWDITSYDI